MDCKTELEITRATLISRNKLIEDLIVLIPENERIFQIALEMRADSFAKDSDIWDKIAEENAGSMGVSDG